jgi:hypothetical protein
MKWKKRAKISKDEIFGQGYEEKDLLSSEILKTIEISLNI